jgi:hypothetical protein
MLHFITSSSAKLSCRTVSETSWVCGRRRVFLAVHAGRIEPFVVQAKRWGQGRSHLKTVIYPTIGDVWADGCLPTRLMRHEAGPAGEGLRVEQFGLRLGPVA